MSLICDLCEYYKGVGSKTRPKIKNSHSAISCIAFIAFLRCQCLIKKKKKKIEIRTVCNVWIFG